jgi:hypothetical protein
VIVETGCFHAYFSGYITHAGGIKSLFPEKSCCCQDDHFFPVAVFVADDSCHVSGMPSKI